MHGHGKKKPHLKAKHDLLKRKLAERSLSPVQEANEVMIRDILAVYYVSATGEFNFAGDSYVPEMDILRRDESEAHLIDRLFGLIKQLAKCAQDDHLERNYDNPAHYCSMTEMLDTLEREGREECKKNNTDYVNDVAGHLRTIHDMQTCGMFATMKPDCKNNVTRLITHEFFFYPCKSRGPLSSAGFTKLIGSIEALARSMPDNIHLVLATFPVANEFNEVSNMLVHVQTGIDPALDIFAKAFPSNIDPEYPGFNNVTFRGDVISSSRGLNADLYQYLEVHGYGLVRPEAKSTAGDDEKSGAYTQSHGGNVTCVTAGGKVFITAADICLDVFKQASQKYLKQNVSVEKRMLGRIIPTHISHVVSSSSIDIQSNNYLTKSRSLSHADSLKSIAGIWQQEVKTNAAKPRVALGGSFGSDYETTAYEPMALDQVLDDIASDMGAHHELVVTLAAYRLLREHYPFEASIISSLIDKELTDYFIKSLEAIDDYTLSVTAFSMYQGLLECFTPEFVQSTDFRTDVLVVYDNLKEQHADEMELDGVPEVLSKLEMLRDLVVKDMEVVSQLPLVEARKSEEPDEKEEKEEDKRVVPKPRRG